MLADVATQAGRTATQRMNKKFLKWLLRFTVLSVILGSIAVIALPWYLGVFLHGIGGTLGLYFASYERIGYSRFALHDVRVESPHTAFTVTCKRIEMPQPLALLFQKNGEYVIEGWHLRLPSQTEKSPAPPTLSEEAVDALPGLLNAAIRSYQQVQPWVKTVKMSDGMFTTGDMEIEVHTVLLQGDGLQIDGAFGPHQQPFNFTALTADLRRPEIRLHLPDQAFNGVCNLRIDEQTVNLDARLSYHNQPITGEAVWQGKGLLPQTAALRCNQLKLSGGHPVFVENYPHPLISVNVSWSQQNWQATGQIKAQPTANSSLPPLLAETRVDGDLERLNIRRLHISGEGMALDLDGPFSWSWGQPQDLQTATFALQADFSEIKPLENVSGQVTGTATLQSNPASPLPNLSFSLSGRNVGYGPYTATSIATNGSLTWPQLTVDDLTVQLPANTLLNVRGRYQLDDQHLENTHITADISSAWIQSIAANDLNWREGHLDLKVEGPLQQLQHKGTYRGKALAFKDYPVGDFELQWTGIGRDVSAFAAEIANPDGLQLQANGGFAYNADKALYFNLNAHSSYPVSDTQTLVGHVAVTADDAHINIDTLQLKHAQNTLLEARGQLPFTLHPGTDKPVQVPTPDAAFDVELICSPDAPFMAQLLAKSGWRIREPSLQASIQGNLQTLRGELSLHAPVIAASIDSRREADPTILENVQLVATIDAHQITLETMQADINGHPLTGRGNLPLKEEDWRLLFETLKLPSFDAFTGEVQWQQVPVQSLSAWLPDTLRNEGYIDGDIAITPGQQWQGSLQLTDAATYPLPPLGALRNIQATIRVQNNQTVIQNLSAILGEQPIRINGNMDTTDLNALAYDLKLKAEDIPIVRTGGFVLRGSPDLQLLTNDGVTTLSGMLILRDSFFTINLADLQASLQSGPTQQGASQVFPYFSIQQEPLRDWKMDVTVQGDSFLRVRTPGFSGTASIDYHLKGDFAEPIATGELKFDQATIRFPFATFKTSQAHVSTSTAAPFEPELQLNARAKKFGYEIFMRGSGPALDPQITFSSAPQLDSSEILLLITTAQVPRSEYTKTSAQRLQGIGMFFGKGLLAELGWFSPKEDRLYIRIGEDITETGRDTVEVEYELTDELSAVGQYDRFDTYNLDLHWKVFEK